MAKLGERCEKPKPLVGAPAGKLVLSGRPLVMPFPEPLVLPMVIGELALWEKTGGRSGTYRRGHPT